MSRVAQGPIPVSKGIRVDQEVYDLLKAAAGKFESPNSVLRRLLRVNRPDPLESPESNCLCCERPTASRLRHPVFGWFPYCAVCHREERRPDDAELAARYTTS